MANTYKTYSIPRVTADAYTEEEALDRFNSPIASIETALDDLSGRLERAGGRCAVIYEHVPLSDTCFVGALVYYDAESARFAPAVAALLPQPGEQGESVEAPSSRVVGMVVRLDTDMAAVHGAILCGGYWDDQNAVRACAGEDATPGTYYLSSSAPGRAVTADKLGGALRQGMFTYMGNGKLLFGLHYLAHDNHWHASRVAYAGWTSVSVAVPESTEVPAGCNYWYDESADTAADEAGYSRLGALQERTTAVFHNGLLQLPGQSFVLSGGYLWYSGTSAPEQGSVTIFNSFPFAYGSPVIRDVVSTNDALTVTKRNGTVMLSQNALLDSGTSRSASAIASLSGRRVRYTPVLSGIVARAGVSASVSQDGLVTIWSSSTTEGLRDAYVIDHNGTNRADDGVFPYVLFPAGRLASLTMTLPVTGIGDDVTLRARVWIMAIGRGSYTTSTRWVPQPSSGVSVSLSGLGTVTGSLAGGADDDLSYLETSTYVTLSGSGTLVTRLAVSSAPASDFKVFRLGYRLELVGINEPAQGVTVVEGTGMVAHSGTAASAIAKYTALRATSAGLVPCSASVAGNANECIGISLEAVDSGETLDYVSCGVVQDPGLGFDAGSAIYIGTGGQLTAVDPSENDGVVFMQRVGTALPGGMMVNIETAVAKEQ